MPWAISGDVHKVFSLPALLLYLLFSFILCFFHIPKIHGQYLTPFSLEGNNSPKPGTRGARISQSELL